MAEGIEIICVGNELLMGKTLNTNAQWLSKRATVFGIAVKRVTVVADEVAEIASVVREALQRKPRFVMTTGGLGPTFDDKTLEGIAKALNRKLVVNEKALRMVKEKYDAYVRTEERLEMTPPRIKMATIPENTVPVANPVGTAPGVKVDLDGTILIALPGVPSEMEAIFEETIASLLKEASGGNVFSEKSIYADDIMESALAPLIDKVMHDNPAVYIKSHPRGQENKPHMEIHFSSTASVAEKLEERLQEAIIQLSSLIERTGGKAFRDDQAIC